MTDYDQLFLQWRRIFRGCRWRNARTKNEFKRTEIICCALGMSRNEYRKISESKYSCMAVFKQGYKAYPIVVTYDAQSDQYVGNSL